MIAISVVEGPSSFAVIYITRYEQELEYHIINLLTD